jgi:hypothetical protein
MHWVGPEAQHEHDLFHLGTSEIASVPGERIRLCLWMKGVVYVTTKIGADNAGCFLIGWHFLGRTQSIGGSPTNAVGRESYERNLGCP